MKKIQNEYPVPVQTSSASGGTAISVGWRIIHIDGNGFFVRENDKTFTKERYPN